MRALLWLEHHHLIDFFHRDQGARMARMARLTTATSLPPRATWPSGLWRILEGGREECREVWCSCSCNVRLLL